MISPLFSTALVVTLVTSSVFAQTYSASYLPENVPNQTETGQTGYNICGTQTSQTSNCQTAYINSLDDFCLWGPPTGPQAIGESERIEVAYCTKAGHGTRLIPDGTLQGVHFVQTKDYVQITGVGDLTRIGISFNDSGGELDPHGADGNGNPIGGLVFGNSFGQMQQYHEWSNFVSSGMFCFRACIGPNAAIQCQHIYDVMGCQWNMPGNYNPGVFETCQGDDDIPMGLYPQGASTSTWFQGITPTPPANPPAPSSSCTTVPTLSNGFTIAVPTPSVSGLVTQSNLLPTATGNNGTHTSYSDRSVSMIHVLTVLGCSASLSFLAFFF